MNKAQHSKDRIFKEICGDDVIIVAFRYPSSMTIVGDATARFGVRWQGWAQHIMGEYDHAPDPFCVALACRGKVCISEMFWFVVEDAPFILPSYSSQV